MRSKKIGITCDLKRFLLAYIPDFFCLKFLLWEKKLLLAFPTNEITSCFSKRLKNKKSSSELKHEENLKLKERLHLEKKIASLRATFDEQNVRNQRLKRIKLDLNSGRVKNETPVDLIRKSQGESKPCRVEGKTATSESFFSLPDLNITPAEDELLYGTTS
ncbi:hypothetical protein Bca4012_015525 [Brassica carinata]